MSWTRLHKKGLSLLLALSLLFGCACGAWAEEDAPAEEEFSEESAGEEDLTGSEDDFSEPEEEDGEEEFVEFEEEDEDSEAYADGELDEFGEEEEDDTVYWVEYDYHELTIGNPTPLRGRFFTSCWGGNTSDLDVQALLHGCALTVWAPELGRYRINHRVVSGALVEDDAKGNRTYHISLQKDLVYSDGTPITAWDYAYSLLFQIDPAIAQTGGIPMDASCFVGVDEYLRGESKAVRGIRVLGDYQLDLTVRAEDLPYFYELSRLSINPYPRHIITPDNKILDSGKGVYFSPMLTSDILRRTVLDSYTGYLVRPIVTSGPYVLASFDGKVAHCVANPLFVGDENGNRPVLRDLYYSSDASLDLIHLLSEGEYGLLNKITYAPALLRGIQMQDRQNHQYTMVNYPRTGLAMIQMSLDSAPLQDLSVRKALALCMDREEVLKSYVGPYGIQINGLYGIGQWTFQTLNTGSYPIASESEEDGESGDDGMVLVDGMEVDAETAGWEALSAALEELELYEEDPEEAVRLLEADGWNLNEAGEPYAAGTDSVRCKRQADGSLLALKLRVAIPEPEATRRMLEIAWLPGLEAAGIQVELQAMSMAPLEDVYDGMGGEAFDAVLVGEDFSAAFDPTPLFALTEEEQAAWEARKNSPLGEDGHSLYAVYDRTARLSDEMAHTANSDIFTYMTRWMAMQQEINEELPLIPLYSNVYFDFYTRELNNYRIDEHYSLGEAMTEAGMSSAGILEPEVEEEITKELKRVEALFTQYIY